eukprot:scaffold149609_cov28-Tisochrysis_lutea.AAC.1
MLQKTQVLSACIIVHLQHVARSGARTYGAVCVDWSVSGWQDGLPAASDITTYLNKRNVQGQWLSLWT